ncbi:MAG: YihY family inner membrane protein [Gammaproteobacteria bacterium]|nr:YihY family inner membrane protein [Gammaproteobacteria bacterium]
MIDIGSLRSKLVDWLWADTRRRPQWARRIIGALQITFVVVRDLIDGELTLRAMSLVYTTLLSLVPLLAVSFSVLKAFGVHFQIEPLLLDFLAPLGPKGQELTGQVIGFVENVNVGVLGSIGLIVFIYTVVSLIHKIEVSFNLIWQVEQHRPFLQRFSHYVSVTLVGPVLVVTVLGLSASLMNTWVMQQLSAIEPFGTLLEITTELLPFTLIVAAFTAIYLALPNTRVYVTSALVGGIVAGLLWQGAGWAFAWLVAGSTRYTAIYAGFAIVIVAMIWVYVCWAILLTGAAIAFYYQHPERRLADGLQPFSIAATEALALCAMALIVRRFQGRSPPLPAQALAAALHVPSAVLAPILSRIEEAGLLCRVGDSGAYVPALAPDTIAIDELLLAVRGAQTLDTPSGTVTDVITRLTEARRDALSGATVQDLAGAPSGGKEHGTTSEPIRRSLG